MSAKIEPYIWVEEDHPIDHCYNGNTSLKKTGVKVNLSDEQKDELAKCKRQPLYFIEKYCKILSVDDGIIPFRLFAYQKKMIKMIIQNRFTIFKFPRQYGKTTTSAAIFLWLVLFTEEYSIALLANKREQSNEILERLKMMYEFLPWWMQVGVSKWNEGSIKLGNRSRIICAATGGSSIRGRSLSLVYLDEFAHIENDVAFYTSVYPTITSGKKTKVVITSTPKGMNMFYRIWMDAENNRNSFVHLHVHWTEYPGHDDDWRTEQLNNMSERQFAQEFELEFLGSSDTLLSAAALQRLAYQNPKFLIGDNKDFKIYQKPQPKHSYVMCVDTSEGIGLDYSVISIIDVTEMPYRQVAMLRSNILIPTMFAELVFQIGTLYNEALAIVETNSIGQQVVNELWDMEYENVLITMDTPRGAAVREGGKRSLPGVKTTVKTKAIGCSNLKALVESTQLIINDFDTIQELSNFIKKKKSFEADAGHTDDIVMTLVMFAWFTAQVYFSDWTDINTNHKIKESLMNHEDQIGFIFLDDGVDEQFFLGDM